jgi:PASTA domain
MTTGADRGEDPTTRRPSADRGDDPATRRPSADRGDNPTTRRPAANRGDDPTTRRPAAAGSGPARPRRVRRYGLLGLALAGATGFLAGVLLVAILGGAKPVYKERTLTVSRPLQGTAVPSLVGQRLDVALDRLQSAGLKGDVSGGGLFGILDEGDWRVVDQDPSAGARLRQGDTVRLNVDRA